MKVQITFAPKWFLAKITPIPIFFALVDRQVVHGLRVTQEYQPTDLTVGSMLLPGVLLRLSHRHWLTIVQIAWSGSDSVDDFYPVETSLAPFRKYNIQIIVLLFFFFCLIKL